MLRTLALSLVLILLCGAAVAQKSAADPTKKLGAFLGTWHTEGVMGSGGKITSTLDCRWSPQGNFLVCEQDVKLPTDEHHQLSVYSYSTADKVFFCTTFADPGHGPNSTRLEIDGNKWTYTGGFEVGGKRVLYRTTNEFSPKGTYTFKAEQSNDNGAHWGIAVQGTGRKGK
jgi:hypothetical protein